MTSVHGTQLDIPTPDGVADAYLAHPDDGTPHPGVLLYMDAFGLRPSLEEMARRLAGHGYTVLVPNVMYRAGRAPVVDLPEFIDPSERPEIFAQLSPIMQAFTPDLAMRDAGAYLDWLAASPLVADGPVGTTGYCMGGVLGIRTAAAYPDRIGAAASFHMRPSGHRCRGQPAPARRTQHGGAVLRPRRPRSLDVGRADREPGTDPGRRRCVLPQRAVRGCPARLHPDGHRRVQLRGGSASLAQSAGALRPCGSDSVRPFGESADLTRGRRPRREHRLAASTRRLNRPYPAAPRRRAAESRSSGGADHTVLA